MRTTAQTGVEMEALTAVSVAALTIYDMVKAVDKAMVIGEIRLLEKRGGRSGRVPGEPASREPATVTILVSIHSGFRMWTIPAESVDWLRAQFPDHHFLHARNDEEGRATDR